MEPLRMGSTNWKYFPLFISLDALQCLIVGGGSVALRKVLALLDSNANIDLVSPSVLPELETLGKKGLINIKKRRFRDEDLEGVNLVIVSTNDTETNECISDEAKRRKIICNVVDRPELCSAIFPSILSRGRLQLAISTGGASPAMARFIKEQISDVFGKEYELALEILWRLRGEILRDNSSSQPARREIFQRFVNSEFIELCKRRDRKKIKAMLSETAGEAVGLRVLEGLLDTE
jgi:precorrin-2 dehydrogenase/sirohydrochlorin ferrochelatase